MTAREETYKKLAAARTALESLNTHAKAHEIRQDAVIREAISRINEESALLLSRLARLDARADGGELPPLAIDHTSKPGTIIGYPWM